MILLESQAKVIINNKAIIRCLHDLSFKVPAKYRVAKGSNNILEDKLINQICQAQANIIEAINSHNSKTKDINHKYQAQPNIKVAKSSHIIKAKLLSHKQIDQVEWDKALAQNPSKIRGK